MTLIKTARLILRPWRQDDLEPFVALNADPKVMESFPSVLTSEESDELLRSSSDHIERYGFGKCGWNNL